MVNRLTTSRRFPKIPIFGGMEQMIATVPHSGIKAFIKESAKKPGPYKTSYLVLAILAGIVIGAFPAYALTSWIFGGTSTYAIQAGLGFVFSFSVLIVIHEWIHGLAYKIYGAKNVYYGGSIKQFVFYAASDGDVFTGRQFRVIAFAPFAAVTTLCLVLMLLFPQYVFLLLTILSLHTMFCGGDFLFIHFLSQHGLDRVRTYDSREKAESYFYRVD